jgi:hypothetical protein
MTTFRKGLAAAGCLVALGAAAIVIFKEDAPEDSAVSSPKRDADEQLSAVPAPKPPASGNAKQLSGAAKEEVAQLRSQIEQLEASLSSIDAKQKAKPEPAQGDRRQESPEEAEARERAHTQKLIGFLDSRFGLESADGGSGGDEKEIGSLFTGKTLEASELKNATCRTSMCRIEATHASSDAEQAFLHGLVSLRTFGDSDAFTERYVRPDGSIDTQTFISRAGQRLPEPNFAQ